ncbi:hypothetical protein ACOSP7_026563 [Xanthoceras sorbifolium]
MKSTSKPEEKRYYRTRRGRVTVRGGGIARRGREVEEDWFEAKINGRVVVLDEQRRTSGGRVKVVQKRTSGGRVVEEQWCYAKSDARTV